MGLRSANHEGQKPQASSLIMSKKSKQLFRNFWRPVKKRKGPDVNNGHLFCDINLLFLVLFCKVNYMSS